MKETLNAVPVAELGKLVQVQGVVPVPYARLPDSLARRGNTLLPNRSNTNTVTAFAPVHLFAVQQEVAD